jgi:hypothetical protein
VSREVRGGFDSPLSGRFVLAGRTSAFFVTIFLGLSTTKRPQKAAMVMTETMQTDRKGAERNID